MSTMRHARLSSLSEDFYLVSLALLPWRFFPPLPWLHAHAQWSDLFIALAAVLWIIDLGRMHRRPPLAPAHAAMGLYVAWAALSLLVHRGDAAVNPWKLLGMAELAMLGVVTADFVLRPKTRWRACRVIAVTTVLTAVAAIIGEVLFLAGIETPFFGVYGDLIPGRYARVRAGFVHPNLLASYSLFAWGVTSALDNGLSRKTRRLVLAAIAATILLTFSRAALALIVAILVGRSFTPLRRWIAGLSAAAVGALLLCLTFINISVNPVRFWELALDPQPSVRREALLTSIWSVAQAPVFGRGPGALAGRAGGFHFDAHCTPVNVAATLGLPALLAFVSIWILLWKDRQRPTDRAVWGALCAMALDGLTHDIEDFRHLWILFGFGAGRAGDRSAQQEQRRT